MAKQQGLIKWDEELAKQAQVAAGMEASTATGQFFSVKAGVLSWNDAPLPGNQMAVIILDAILENVYYEGAFDPANPTPPTCFAFGREDAKLAPHAVVVEHGSQQSELCKDCRWSAWGTATRDRKPAKGKACRQTRRLALIGAGSFNEHTGKLEPITELDHYKDTVIGFLRLPVTSVKGYSAFVKATAATLKVPPHGLVTRVKVTPDAKNQIAVTFEPLTKVPAELLAVIMQRRAEAVKLIDQPYQLGDDDTKAKPARGSRQAPASHGKTAPARGKLRF